MNLRSVRWPVVVAALVLTLGVLFGVRWLYESRALDRPILEAVRAVPGVSDVVVSRSGDVLEVKVKVGDVSALEQFVAELRQAVGPLAGGREVRIELSDTRTLELEKVYYDFHFYVQEAVATGRYSLLPTSLKEVAGPDKVTSARVFVDSDYVYVELHKDGSALYQVVPRAGTSGEMMSADQNAGGSRISVTVRPWGGWGG